MVRLGPFTVDSTDPRRVVPLAIRALREPSRLDDKALHAIIDAMRAAANDPRMPHEPGIFGPIPCEADARLIGQRRAALKAAHELLYGFVAHEKVATWRTPKRHQRAAVV